MTDLFANSAAYTIDMSSFLKIFKESEESFYKGTFTSLWEKIEEAFNKGEIISHIQVFDEIMKFDGEEDELMKWAKANKHIFKDYDLPAEPDFIRQIGATFPQFLSQGKFTVAHADPWLLAQAHVSGLKIISDEGKMKADSLHIVAKAFKIPSTNVYGLIKEKKWKM